MPVDYKKYHPQWKGQIVPDILKRAGNCCEVCKVENGNIIFRGYIKKGLDKKEVYQDVDGRVFDTENGNLLFKDIWADIEPFSGNINQAPIKIVLTIAHLDHDIENNDYNNLKAMCQLHHLRYDAKHKAEKRKAKKNQLKLL
jgi:hypothetical protein